MSAAEQPGVKAENADMIEAMHRICRAADEIVAELFPEDRAAGVPGMHPGVNAAMCRGSAMYAAAMMLKLLMDNLLPPAAAKGCRELALHLVAHDLVGAADKPRARGRVVIDEGRAELLQMALAATAGSRAAATAIGTAIPKADDPTATDEETHTAATSRAIAMLAGTIIMRDSAIATLRFLGATEEQLGELFSLATRVARDAADRANADYLRAAGGPTC